LKNNTYLLSLGILVLLISAVYGHTLFSSFHFDDRSSILMNPVLRSGADAIPELWRYWPTRFIVTISFYMNYQAGGIEPFGYHLINLVIHIINSLLVCGVLLYSVKKIRPNGEGVGYWPALAGGLIFALHPIQTQAVSYIAQRAASLAATFYLAGLLLYIRAGWGRPKFYYSLAWLSGAAAMLCKEMSVTFPLAIILWDLVFANGKPHRRKLRWSIFLILLLIIPLTVLLDSGNPKYNDSGQLGGGEISTGFEKFAGGVEAPDRLTYGLTQIRVLKTYLRLILLPINQNLDYDFPVSTSFFNLEIIFSSILIISILLGAVLLHKAKKPAAAFGIFFFFLALLPESSFIPIRDLIFEHRLYLPLLGLAFAVAQLDFSSRGLRILFGLIIFLLATMTFSRNRIWMDEITLWTDTAKKSSGKARPHNNLGYLFNQDKQYKKARLTLGRAIEITPDYPEAMVNLAISYKNMDKLILAEEISRRALEIKPGYPEGHNTLGDIRRLRGRLPEAEVEYRRAIELNPGLAAARNNLANLYREMGEPERAAAQYSKALNGGKDNPVYLNNIGLSLLEQGRLEEGIRSFLEAIAINPELAPAHYNLGNALFKKGDLKAARESFRRAVDIDPQYVRAFFNLGVVESKLGNWDDARESFLSVIKLEPENVQAHLKAGLIYFLLNNDPRTGAPYLRRALELDPELPERAQIEELLHPDHI
jgi:protein O-mannosyl-transferase